MPRASTSLDLSEFFNNDDSDGHRLAEFLQKRRGDIQRQKFLFMGCESQRLSLKVQLEKLPPSQQGQCANNEKQVDKLMSEKGAEQEKVDKTKCKHNKVETNVKEHELAVVHHDKCIDNLSNIGKKDALSNDHNCKKTLSPVILNNIHSPSVPLSPLEPMSQVRFISPSKPLSPVKSKMRKSGGVSSSDRLRKYSLKRLSNICGGRRTLLREFESTVSDSNFDPPICSTPLSQPPPEKVASPAVSVFPEAENMAPNTAENSDENYSRCGHTNTLIRSLQRKEEELEIYMDKVMETTLKKVRSQSQLIQSHNQMAKENTAIEEINIQQSMQEIKSPSKYTYTLEKGVPLDQVILTPDGSSKNESTQNSKLLRSQMETSLTRILKTPKRKMNHPKIQTSVKGHENNLSPKHLGNPILSKAEGKINQKASDRETTTLSISQSVNEQREFPAQNNASIVYPTEDVNIEIPETQVLPMEEDGIIQIHSNNRNMPVVIIPITQTFNKTYTEEDLNNSIVTAKPKTLEKSIPANIVGNNQVDVNENHQDNELNEDNLKLVDIITDDEDEVPPEDISYSVENSQSPLNLVQNPTNIRTKRLHKRTISRRRLQINNSQILSTETETEPPPAHNNSNSGNRRRIVRRKHITLNRAPGIPLNGEKFAQELARMSNYEILDLRKRNSMGRVFPISYRRSTRSQESAVKKQLELDDQIEIELLRRNLEKVDGEQSSRTVVSAINSEIHTKDVQESVDQYPLVPDEFRDSLVKQQQIKGRESSLVDERSTDRVSFKNKKSILSEKSRRGREKPMPEVLKNYLEISEILTRKKKRSDSLNQSKRSLYNQEQSELQNRNSSEDCAILATGNPNRRYKKQSILCVPSPPKSVSDQITALKVVSPPPSLTPVRSIRREQKAIQESPINAEEIETLPPPPPEFDSDLGVNSHNFNVQSTIDNNIQTAELTAIQSTTNVVNNKDNNINDEIFKKPLHPPPKRPGRKPKVSKTMSNKLLHTSEESQNSDKSTDIADGTLRRSKRGQVPLKHPVPIFQILLQQNLNKRLQQNEKRRKLQQVSKLDEGRSKSIKSISSQKTIKSTKAKNKKLRLPTVPENNPLITPTYEDSEINNEKSTKNTEAKVKRKHYKNKRTKSPSDEAFEYSRISLTTPPPIDHLNNVFNHLRNSSSTMNSQSSSLATTENKLLVPGIKPLRVRIARPKFPSQTTESESEGPYPSTKKSQEIVKVNNSNSNTITTTSGLISTSTVGSSNTSNHELISWLKNITESGSSTEYNGRIFKEMHISAAANLSFTELQGVEYAFYDTDEKASLGYLRFKPRQIKPKKKAKRFHLHFVTLVGNFRITANNEESRLNVGDMVAIEKSVYYDIENLTDDIGILMVIKK